MNLYRQYRKDRQQTTELTVKTYIEALPIRDQADIFQINDQMFYPTRLGGRKLQRRPPKGT